MGKYHVYLPSCDRKNLTDHELSAAEILADYYQQDVYWLTTRPSNKMPDLMINGTMWELKSPTGQSRRTIQNNLRRACQQSKNVIIDLRRCPQEDARVIARIKHELSGANMIKRLLVIKKNKQVMIIK